MEYLTPDWDAVNNAQVTMARLNRELVEQKGMVSLLIRTIEEMCSDSICITDHHGNIRYKNSACQELFQSCGINVNSSVQQTNNQDPSSPSFNYLQPNLYNLFSHPSSVEFSTLKTLESFVARIKVGDEQMDPLTGRPVSDTILCVEGKRHSMGGSEPFLIHKISLSDEEREQSIRCYREMMDLNTASLSLWQIEHTKKFAYASNEDPDAIEIPIFTLLHSNEKGNEVLRQFPLVKVGRHLHEMFGEPYLTDLSLSFKRALKEQQDHSSFVLNGVSLNITLHPLRHGLFIASIENSKEKEDPEKKKEAQEEEKREKMSVVGPVAPPTNHMSKASQLLVDALGILRKVTDEEGNVDFAFFESNVMAKTFRTEPSLFGFNPASAKLSDMVPAFQRQKPLLKVVGESEVGAHFKMIIADHINVNYDRAVWKVCMTRIEGDFFSFHCNKITRKSVNNEQLGWNPRGTFPFNVPQPIDGVYFFANHLEGILDLNLGFDEPLFPSPSPPISPEEERPRTMAQNLSPPPYLQINPDKPYFPNKYNKLPGVSYYDSRMSDPDQPDTVDPTIRRMVLSQGGFSMPNDMWDTVFDESPVGMVIANEERYLKANKKFGQIVGYSAEELSKEGHLLPITHPEDGDKSRPIFHGVPMLSWVKRYLHKEGHIVYCVLFGRKIVDSKTGQSIALGIVIPLDDLKRTFYEENCTIQNELWFQSFSKSIIRVCLLNCDGVIIDVNEAFLKGLNLTKEQVHDKYFVELLKDEEKQKISESIQGFSNGKSKSRMDVLGTIQVNGANHEVAMSIYPMFDTKGNVTHILMEHRDVS